jgi:ATP-binding cassette subfamily F protein 3
MLSVHQLSKTYILEPVLAGVSFTVNAGERLGLVGPNGCGKTTLLRIVAGAETSDGGHMRRDPGDLRVGYLPQGLAPAPGATIGAHLLPPADAAEVARLAAALAALPASGSATAPARGELARAYDGALARLAAAEGAAARAPALLAALGLGDFTLDTPVAVLSGGQKTRLALAGVLLVEPELLLLDEPTNHLDLDMLAWLEDWLCAFRGGVLVVSHDRAFLDRVATGILDLDGRTHTLRAYAGNYSDYVEAVAAEHARAWQDYSDAHEEIARLAAAARQVRGIAAFRKGGKGDTGDKFARGFFGNRSAGTVRRAKALERRVEELRAAAPDKPRPGWQLKLDFGGAPPSGRAVLALEEVAVGYGRRALLSGLNLHVRYGARVVLVGPNGCGKTTLLRTIAGVLEPLAGRVVAGANVRLGYMAQEQEELDPRLGAYEAIRRVAPFSETEARAFLHQFLFAGDDVFVPAGQLSYGERARLALAGLVARGCNFLLLDEPLNHLDIPSRTRFEQALEAFEGTALVVTHDRYFIAGFATEVWEAGQGAVQVMPAPGQA